jgi:hypothetical protein
MLNIWVSEAVEDVCQITLARSVLRQLESYDTMNSPTGTTLLSLRDYPTTGFRVCQDLGGRAEIQTVMTKTSGYLGGVRERTGTHSGGKWARISQD